MAFKLAWQQLLANWKAGDLRVLLMALVLAVAAITAVSAFSQRISSHLNSQGGMLLGGDLVVISDQAMSNQQISYAQTLGLLHTQTAEFPSMVVHGELSQLAEIKALGELFPLRGDFSVKLTEIGPAQSLSRPPAKGEVWLELRLMSVLGLKLGDAIELGVKSFRVAGVLEREPSRGGDMFSFAPRVMMHLDDLPATELVQYGSRVKHQLILAGNADALQQFSDWVKPQLDGGSRIEDVKTARPEIKSALDKAEVFLGLSAMVSVVLSVIAMLLASAPFIQRCLDTFAMLRCFGAQQALIQRVLLWQTLSIAVIGGLVGCALGYALQQGLSVLAGRLFVETLAPASIQPFVLGMAVSLCVMLALMWPHIAAIKHLATIRILRREVELNLKQDWLNYVPVSLVVIALIWQQAHTLKMALLMLAGLLVTCALIAVLAYVFVHALFKLNLHQQSPLVAAVQVGLSNLKRRLRLSMAQMIAFGLGLTVIILLSIVKTDLMDSWQSSLPVDAPNRFVINLQADQLPAFTTFFKNNALSQPTVYPMVKGRLVAINQRAVSADDYDNERAKRLVSREFNLSWASKMQADNRLLEGAWWTANEAGEPYISLEQDLASALKIKLNDTLSYDIAGTQIELKVSSIRKVEWDSMRANFFAVTPPQVLAPFNASYMTAFYLPPEQKPFIHQLVKTFPNLTVIDVAALMEQVRGIMQKMSVAVAYVFLFSLVSGLAVLFAALIATQEARIRESALLRALGASRLQVGWAMLAEFFSIALVAVTVAIVLANALALVISHYVLDIPYHLNAQIVIVALLSALMMIPAAAWLVLKRHLNTPPKHILNSI